MEPTPSEKKEFSRALFLPLLILFIIWSVKVLEWLSGLSFETLGIFPRKTAGLIGILFSPVLHGDIWHLLNNSVPFLVLATTLFYFYKKVAVSVFSLIWLISGLCVWIAGREAYHIGASGVIYGLATFLFFSGLFRRNIKLLAISLMVTFLYGSMVWGIFPFFKDISWESHLFGALTGLTFSFIYSRELNKEELQPEPEEDTDEYEFPYWEQDIDDFEETDNTKPNNTKDNAY